MNQKHLRLAAGSALILSSSAAMALPFNSFDPRTMSMGGAGVAVGDPATAPFFNPALLSASDPSKKYSFELPIIGVRLYDPAKMRDTLPTLSDDSNALTASTTPLTNNSATLSTDTNTLTTSITNASALTIGATPTAATLTTLSSNLTTVRNNMTTVSVDMATVASNSTTVQTNLNKVNSALIALNNKPLQGEFGAATVIGVPGKNYGMAFYANAYGAAGGTLIYKDATTVSSISSALGTASTALTSSSNLIGTNSTALADLNAAITALNTASASCAISTTSATCLADLAAAQTALATAQASLSATSTTLGTNATSITNAANTVSANKTALSQVHLRGVLISEAGFSISHGLVTRDQEWAVGVTPKYMQLTLFDALLDTNSTTSNATSSDNTAKYSTLNFDLGVAKSYLNGWRTGVVVKNVLPQSFDFKRAQTPTGDKLTLNPQLRAGVSHETAWSTLAFDLDLTQNDPAGLENRSQYAALGGELSAFGWAQLRAGYRADMLNSARNVTSFGLGVAPRIPYFKVHFDLAYAYNADEQGASLRLGMNF